MNISSFRRTTSGGKYLQELDVLRFLSIFFVIYCHLATGPLGAYAQVDYSLSEYMKNGANGVRIFFAISGFILAIPFLKSVINLGAKNISLKKYFFRRLERLEPPYLVAITLMYVAGIVFLNKGYSLSNYFSTITYSHILIYQIPSFILSVTWSLEIEVQFYILMPFLSKLFSKKINL
jgi:peptidoglycan/LPS O-acetylase OafA/YrhL